MRIIIIGAGPTGLGAAYRLKELGLNDFTIYEQADYVGGLATSFKDDKGYTWDFAVHVAHSHYRYVDSLMEKLLPDGFYTHERRSWVRLYDSWVPYPFQNNFRHLPEQARQACVDGLQQLPDHKTPKNFHEWILQSFGQGIADHFMVPYNEKIWRTHPRDMNCHWLGDRVPEVDVQRVMDNLKNGTDDVSWGPNHTFTFPKEGGTGAIWNALADEIGMDHIRLNTKVAQLDIQSKTVTLNDGSQEPYDYCISTMPLKELTTLCGVEHLQKQSQQLRHTHVQVAGIAPDFSIPGELDQKTWIYCPDKEAAFYRVTPFSIFSPAHIPHKNTCSFLVEFSTPGDKPMIKEDLKKLTLDGMRKIGLLDADPDRTHSFMMETAYGYPVPTTNRDEILHELLPELEALNIYSRGRFGGWKYEAANMDHSIMQGVEAVNHILEKEAQPTIYTPNKVNAGKQ